MNNNKIQNQKTELPETTALNDSDYLNQVLECTKNMSVNLAIALNEASNQKLYDEFYQIFNDLKKAQRDLYNMAFKNGWYSLEKAEAIKIDEKVNELNQKLNQLT